MLDLMVAPVASPLARVNHEPGWRQARGLTFSHGPHGPEACSCLVPMSGGDAMRYYEESATLLLTVHDGYTAVWAGRLSRAEYDSAAGGLRVEARGLAEAIDDLVYTALWAEDRSTPWVERRQVDTPMTREDMFETDTNSRLYVAPRKNGVFTAGWNGGLIYRRPNSGTNTIVRFTASYAFLASSSWDCRIVSWQAGFASGTVEWTITGTGVLQTGSIAINLANTNVEFVGFEMRANAGVTYSGESGAEYARLTVPVVLGTTATVTADLVVASIAGQVAALGNGVSASAARIASPGVTMSRAVYEDAQPSRILDELARRGDSATPPLRYEWQVDEDGRVVFRAQDSEAIDWMVAAADLQAGRDITTMTNSVYATFEEPGGFTLRTAAATDATSLAREGITRQGVVAARTTSATEANIVRDAALQDQRDPQARVRFRFSRLEDAGGGPHPLWSIRSGDRITARNLPPTLIASGIDQVRTIRVARATYNADDDTVEVEPRDPIPTLENVLAAK